jgi:hypothetical protein
VPDNDGLRMVASGQGLWDNQEDQHDSLQPLLQQQHAAAGATCNGDSCASPMNAITSSILNLVGLAPQATPNAQQTRSMSTGLQTPAAQAMARGVARPATSYTDLNDELVRKAEEESRARAAAEARANALHNELAARRARDELAQPPTTTEREMLASTSGLADQRIAALEAELARARAAAPTLRNIVIKPEPVEDDAESLAGSLASSAVTIKPLSTAEIDAHKTTLAPGKIGDWSAFALSTIAGQDRRLERVRAVHDHRPDARVGGQERG